MVEYDVLGNERHKAICKLREMPKLFPNKDGGADLYAWKSALADAIGANTELFSAISDRLIHLLGGDQPKFSELLKGDDDGVDARPSDSASADSPVHGAAGCGCGGACGCDGEELLAPITTELRDMAERYCNFKDDTIVKFSEEEFDCLCDIIDAIHAGLERDYATACRVNEQQDLEYIDLAKRYDKTISLPLDADGVPIRVGDVVRLTESWRDLTVLGVGIVDAHEHSWGVFVREGSDYVWYNAEFLHHQTTTVEDVLREFAEKMNENMGMYTGEAIDADEWRHADNKTIADYAAKLKLADA